jgi:hypothetical protein
MALLFKAYTPTNAICFSSDGKLIIGDNNGSYNATINPNGWGSPNPAESTITSAVLTLVNISSGIEYLNVIELVSAPFELYATNKQIEVLATDYTLIKNLRYNTTEANTQTAFEEGFYLITITNGGEYALGGDTVFWTGDSANTYIIPNFSCWQDTLESYALSNCKKSKKAENLMRYYLAAQNYLRYFKFNSNITNDEWSKIDVLNALANKTVDVCTNREGGCKC